MTERSLLWNTLTEGNYLLINKHLIRSLGLNAAVLLTDLISKEKYFAVKDKLNEGWFFNTQEDREKDTGLSPYKQRKILEDLSEKDLVESKLKGLPAKLFFRLNHTNIAKLLMSTNFLNSSTENKSQDVKKLNNSNNIKSNKNKPKKVTSEEVTAEASSANSLSIPRKKKRRKKNLKNIPSSIDPLERALPVLEYWNSLGAPLTVHRRTSKVTKDGLNGIVKKLQDGFTVEEIISAMDKYYALISSSDSRIGTQVVGHKVSLPEFFKFSSFQLGQMEKQKNGLKVKSWFDECRSMSEDDLLRKYAHNLVDKNPEITKVLKEQYAKRISKVSEPKFSVKQESQFILGAKKLKDFHKKLNGNFKGSISIEKLTVYLFRALDKNFGHTVGVGNLASDATYNQFLPAYLTETKMYYHAKAGLHLDEKGAH